jgi:hypothetical protein
MKQAESDIDPGRVKSLNRAGWLLIGIGVLLVLYGFYVGQLSSNLVAAATRFVFIGVAAIAGGGALRAAAEWLV